MRLLAFGSLAFGLLDFGLLAFGSLAFGLLGMYLPFLRNFFSGKYSRSQLAGKVLAFLAKYLLRQVFPLSARLKSTCLSRENSSQASIPALCRLEKYLPFSRKLFSGKYSCSIPALIVLAFSSKLPLR